MSFGVPHGFHKSHCCQILGKTQELQDSPACNFVLRSLKRNEAAAEPERVNLGKHRVVWVRAALLLVCLVVTSATLNTTERSSAWKTQTRLQPTQCVQSPTRTGNAGASQCFSWLWLWVWRGVELPESHIPSTAPVGPSSACQTPQWECSQLLPDSFPASGFAAVFGSELSNLQTAHPVLHPITSPHWSQPLGLAPCWHRGAHPVHALPREPPHSAPQAWLQICYSVSKIPLGTAGILSSCCFPC